MEKAALFLALANKLLIDMLTKPLQEKYPTWGYWFLLFYVSVATGTVLGWYSEFNLFVDYMPNVTLARILTALFIGGGSTLIHELINGGLKIFKLKVPS